MRKNLPSPLDTRAPGYSTLSTRDTRHPGGCALTHTEIAELRPADLRPLRAQLLRVYRETFSGPPYNEREDDVVIFYDRLLRHSQYPGFRFLAAMATGGDLLGLTDGYSSLPGQWWHEVVGREMSPELRREWLQGAFDFTELAVRPSARGRGIGGPLHDALLEGLPHPTACLSTHQSQTVALGLYRKRGWVELLRDYHFPGFAQPYLILGKKLSGITTETTESAHNTEGQV